MLRFAYFNLFLVELHFYVPKSKGSIFIIHFLEKYVEDVFKGFRNLQQFHFLCVLKLKFLLQGLPDSFYLIDHEDLDSPIIAQREHAFSENVDVFGDSEERYRADFLRFQPHIFRLEGKSRNIIFREKNNVVS